MFLVSFIQNAECGEGDCAKPTIGNMRIFRHVWGFKMLAFVRRILHFIFCLPALYLLSPSSDDIDDRCESALSVSVWTQGFPPRRACMKWWSEKRTSQ